MQKTQNAIKNDKREALESLKSQIEGTIRECYYMARNSKVCPKIEVSNELADHDLSISVFANSQSCTKDHTTIFELDNSVCDSDIGLEVMHIDGDNVIAHVEDADSKKFSMPFKREISEYEAQYGKQDHPENLRNGIYSDILRDYCEIMDISDEVQEATSKLEEIYHS